MSWNLSYIQSYPCGSHTHNGMSMYGYTYTVVFNNRKKNCFCTLVITHCAFIPEKSKERFGRPTHVTENAHDFVHLFLSIVRLPKHVELCQ